MHVTAADDVPHVDVLLHAAGHAGVLLGGERRAGGGDAGIEAVLIDFLKSDCISVCAGRVDSSRAELVTYSDESAGIVHGRLLLNLLQEGSLDVLVGLGSAGAKEGHGG